MESTSGEGPSWRGARHVEGAAELSVLDYERGSFHYDVMVTLILLFLFVAPRFIDFKDRPVETVALHASEVLVKEAGDADGEQPVHVPGAGGRYG